MIQKSLLILLIFQVTTASALPTEPLVTSIDPDDYLNGTVLNRVHPQVWLRIFSGVSNRFLDSSIFPVTAVDDPFASTGARGFGNGSMSFFPESRQLDMFFFSPVEFVAIDFTGVESLRETIGRLDIYNFSNTLLESFVTPPLSSGEVYRMTLARSQGDISRARAYSDSSLSPFGHLDNLRFGAIAIPEPTSNLLGFIGIASVFGYYFKRNLIKRNCKMR